MATVTVTETGVALVVQLNRDVGGDSISYSATSLTDVAQVAGRQVMGVDLTPLLTPAQMAVVVQVLDAVEARAKAMWNIP